MFSAENEKFLWALKQSLILLRPSFLVSSLGNFTDPPRRFRTDPHDGSLFGQSQSSVNSVSLHAEPPLGVGETPRIDAETALIRAAIAVANSAETRADIALAYGSVALLSISRLKNPSARSACSSNRTSRHVFAWWPSRQHIRQTCRRDVFGFRSRPSAAI